MLTDVTTVREIGFEERLRQRDLLIALFSPPHEPMTGHGIGCHENLVVIKFNAELLSGCGHFSVHGQGSFPATKLFRAVDLAIHASNRHVGIELEQTPDDLGSELLAEHFEAGFHPPFTQVTPWTDKVGVEFDIQCAHKIERIWLRKL